MRVLLLGVHARGYSPSQRYRFEQYEAALSAAAIEVEYASALTGESAALFHGRASAMEKASIAFKAGATRAWSVLPRLLRKKFDVVFVQREAFFLLNEWSEWLASRQAPLVYDFDDAIWIHAISEANRRFAFLKNVEKMPRIAALAHTVIAGNDYLATWARAHNRNVHVIPTCVDTDVFLPPSTPRNAPFVTIGWSGSPSTIVHLRPLLPVLERVKARFGDRVRIRVMGDPTFHHPPLGLQAETWSPPAEVRFLQDMDIGLMPLPDDEWSKGKCGLKGLTSMASAAATVMSPVGVNTSIVSHGLNGFLASSDDEWFETLCHLVEDRALRLKVGAAGRETVIERYSVKRWSGPFTELLLAAARPHGVTASVESGST